MLQLSMQTVVAALIRDRGKLLIAQRSADGPHPLKWEFPGGKVEAGETVDQALIRELEEELGIEAKVGREFARYEYIYPAKAPILLIFFEINTYVGSVRNRGAFAELAWEPAGRFSTYDFLEGDLPLIQLLGEIDVDQI